MKIAAPNPPIPRCPPMLPAGDLRAYRKYVDHLPKGKLLEEYAKQKQNLWAAQHGIRYDPEGEKRALAKLAIVTREMASRGIYAKGGVGDSFQAA